MKKFSQKGYALVTVLLMMVILLLIGMLFVNLAVYDIKIASNQKNSAKAFYIAQAGLYKGIWEIRQPGSTYTGETNTAFAGGRFSVQIQTIDANHKAITSTGNFPTSAIAAKRVIKINLSATESGESIAFHYAVQIGELGLMMYSNSRINGNTYSNGNITGYSNSVISGDAYAVGTISAPTPQVTGTKQEGVEPQPLPSLNVEFWKQQANVNNNPINGNYEVNNCTNPITTLGPRKITGYFRMNSNSCLKLSGPLYIAGDFEMNSNSKLYLDESFGSRGTVVIVDGTILINSNSYIYSTSASPKGYILLASTNIGIPAIPINSNGAGGIFYALSGGIQINSNGRAVAVVGRQLTLNSNATLDYDIGLADTRFTSGPGGNWAIESGSWQEEY